MLCYKWDGMSNYMQLLLYRDAGFKRRLMCVACRTSFGATIWAPGVRMCTGR